MTNSEEVILIGDPHAKIGNLPSLSKIIDLAIENKGKAKHIVLLGDLFDTHAVVRNEISYFWQEQFEKMSSNFETVTALVGNHDQVGSTEKEHVHSLWPFPFIKNNIVIVDKPTKLSFGAMAFPYTANKNKFAIWCEEAKKAEIKTIFTHQTFDGAKYDNGMYAPDGFSLELTNGLNIISGHIHTESSFANVWYPGTSMWESASDANQDKGIWKVCFKDGVLTKKDFFSSESVIPKLISLEIREGDTKQELDSQKRYLIHLIGSSKWISKEKKAYSGHKLKTTFTDSLDRKKNTTSSTITILDIIESNKCKSDRNKMVSYIEGL